jgi:hypothetical protein
MVYEAPEVSIDAMVNVASASRGGPIEMPDHDF